MRLRADQLVMREVGGKTMLLDLSTSTYFAVGGVGTAILKELQDGDVDEQHLIQSLLVRYTVEPERLMNDVATFLDRLEEAGLLVR